MPRKVAKDLTKIEVAESTEKIKVIEEENVSEQIIEPSTSKKTRQVPTRESVLTGFDEIIKMIDAEIQQLHDNSTKNTNIKFLRLLNKTVKSLRVQSSRVMKQKTLTPRQNNQNSGFQKPVKISNELSKFTGWPQDELRSRVDVTKYICDYIASNNLQNPEDKRQILPDAKLQKLLGFNPAKSENPLYYYGIQTHLKNQNHFPKD
jgi:chromatin remodeling complex protein RSC6